MPSISGMPLQARMATVPTPSTLTRRLGAAASGYPDVVSDRFSRKGALIRADLFRSALVLTLLASHGFWHAYLGALEGSCHQGQSSTTRRRVLRARSVIYAEKSRVCQHVGPA